MSTNINSIGDEATQDLVAAGVALASKDNGIVNTTRGEGDGVEPVIAVFNGSEYRLDTKLTVRAREAQKRPLVARENIALSRVEDLCEYLNAHKTDEVRVFAHMGNRITAILDYGKGPDTVGWRRRRAFVPMSYGAVIKKLGGTAGVWLTQQQLAQFVEDNDESVVVDAPGDPDKDQLLAMATDLEVADSTISSFKREKSSRVWTVSYKNEATPKTTVYPAFSLNAPIFEGQEEITLKIRVSIEKRGGEYGFLVRVNRLEALAREEFSKMTETISNDTGVAPIWGEAPGEMDVGLTV